MTASDSFGLDCFCREEPGWFARKFCWLASKWNPVKSNNWNPSRVISPSHAIIENQWVTVDPRSLCTTCTCAQPCVGRKCSCWKKVLMMEEWWCVDIPQ